MPAALQRFQAAVVGLALVFVPLAMAWDDRGHMLVAMIAYQELKPDVRERVDEILRHHPQYDLLTEGAPEAGRDRDMYAFAKAATWPDMVRSTNNPLHSEESHAHWHFVDFPYSPDGTRGPEPVEAWDGHSNPANLLQAMQEVSHGLKAESTTPERRAIDLCWVEHLVGDVHQPLHACTMFSAQFPKGDNGGNSFAVKRGETPTSLHTYWDGVLGRGTSFETLRRQIEGFRDNPELTRTKLGAEHTRGDVIAWAKESRQIAEKDVYVEGKLKGAHHSGTRDYPRDTPELPSDYEEMAKHLAAKRVVLAGYRLADEIAAVVGAQAVEPRRH